MMLGDCCDEVETKCDGVCSDACRILAVALLKEDETRIASCIGVVELLHVGTELQQTSTCMEPFKEQG